MDTTNDDVAKRYAELSRRIESTVILDRIRSGVRDALAAGGHPLPPDATILFDDQKGEVVVIVGGQLVSEAERIQANAVIAPILRVLEATTIPTQNEAPSDRGVLYRPISTPSHAAAWVFWGLNGIILVYWAIWFVNFVFSASFREWYEGAQASSDFGLLGLVLFALLPAIPLMTAASALLAKNEVIPKISPVSALAQFEVPALISAFIANVVFIELPFTDLLRYVLVASYLILLTYWYISYFRVPVISTIGGRVRFALNSFSIWWLGYLVLLFIVPMYLVFFQEVLPDFFQEDFSYLLQSPLMAMLLLVLGLCWLIPAVLVWLLGRHLIRVYLGQYQELASKERIVAQSIVVMTPVLLLAILLGSSWMHNDQRVVDKLVLLAQDEGGYGSQASRARELVSNKSAVDESLRAQLFARQKYLFTTSELKRSDFVGAYIRVVAFPFVYNDKDLPSYFDYGYPSRGGTYEVLAKGYRRAFGEDISTVQTQKVKDPGHVHLVSRDVHVVTDGSPVLATVSVTDSLSSNLPSDQEVVYEFSLPSDAVVTGLRLGAALEYKGEIAPRGAAQQTYVNQVRYMRDPALLEQTGPRQYRLRVYPVPGASAAAANSRREKVEGPLQRVQMTYVVLRDAEGVPLPVYSERYNVIDESVTSTADIDGKNAKLSDDMAFVAAPTAKDKLCAQKGSVSVQLPEGGNARLIFAAERESGAPAMELCDREVGSHLQGKRITFLVDTSYANKDTVIPLLRELRALPPAFFTANTVALVPYGEQLGERIALKRPEDVPLPESLVFFGTAIIKQAIATERNLKGGTDVIVLTGVPTYTDDDAGIWREAITGEYRPPTKSLDASFEGLLGKHVILVHGAKIPAYPARLVSLFGVVPEMSAVTHVNAAVARIEMGRDQNITPAYVGPYWYIETERPTIYLQASSTTAFSGVPHFLPMRTSPIVLSPTLTAEQKALTLIAEHSIIDRMMGVYGYQLVDNSGDKAVASEILLTRSKELGIVTSLASYIALVNDTQRNQLQALSQRSDKFSNETSFSVTSPGFVTPFGGVSSSVFGGSSLGLSGSVTTTAPPAFVVPSDSGVASYGAPKGEYNNPLTYTTNENSTPADDDLLMKQIIILVSTFLLLIVVPFMVYRILKRAHRS